MLRGELARWKTTTTEDRVYDEYFSQLLYAEGTLEHMEDMLKAHTGDLERELKNIEGKQCRHRCLPWWFH